MKLYTLTLLDLAIIRQVPKDEQQNLADAIMCGEHMEAILFEAEEFLLKINKELYK